MFVPVCTSACMRRPLAESATSSWPDATAKPSQLSSEWWNREPEGERRFITIMAREGRGSGGQGGIGESGEGWGRVRCLVPTSFLDSNWTNSWSDFFKPCLCDGCGGDPKRAHSSTLTTPKHNYSFHDLCITITTIITTHHHHHHMTTVTTHHHHHHPPSPPPPTITITTHHHHHHPPRLTANPQAAKAFLGSGVHTHIVEIGEATPGCRPCSRKRNRNYGARMRRSERVRERKCLGQVVATRACRSKWAGVSATWGNGCRRNSTSSSRRACSKPVSQQKHLPQVWRQT